LKLLESPGTFSGLQSHVLNLKSLSKNRGVYAQTFGLKRTSVHIKDMTGTIGFEILLWLSRCKNILGPPRNGPQGSLMECPIMGMSN